MCSLVFSFTFFIYERYACTSFTELHNSTGSLSQKSDILILSNCEILHEQLLLVCFLIGEIITVVFTSLVCGGGPMS